MNILLFGSDRFTVKCIQGIFQRRNKLLKGLDVVLPHSGGEVMEKFAIDNNLKTFKPLKSALPDWVLPNQYDLALVISYGYFLPSRLIQKFPLGGINVHPSLLPKYRGTSPIQYTILNQDPVGGVSIINLNPRVFDSGKILSQRPMEIKHPINFDGLLDKMGDLGSTMLVDTLSNFEAQKLNAKNQDPNLITKAPKITKAEAFINWHNDTCARIFAKHNAFGAKMPLYSTIRSKRIQLLEIHMVEDLENVKNHSVTPGTIHFDYKLNVIYIKCKDSHIAVTRIKMQDKKAIGIKDFFNGYKELDGEVLV